MYAPTIRPAAAAYMQAKWGWLDEGMRKGDGILLCCMHCKPIDMELGIYVLWLSVIITIIITTIIVMLIIIFLLFAHKYYGFVFILPLNKVHLYNIIILCVFCGSLLLLSPSKRFILYYFAGEFR